MGRRGLVKRILAGLGIGAAVPLAGLANYAAVHKGDVRYLVTRVYINRDTYGDEFAWLTCKADHAGVAELNISVPVHFARSTKVGDRLLLGVAL